MSEDLVVHDQTLQKWISPKPWLILDLDDQIGKEVLMPDPA